MRSRSAAALCILGAIFVSALAARGDDARAGAPAVAGAPAPAAVAPAGAPAAPPTLLGGSTAPAPSAAAPTPAAPSPAPAAVTPASAAPAAQAAPAPAAPAPGAAPALAPAAGPVAAPAGSPAAPAPAVTPGAAAAAEAARSPGVDEAFELKVKSLEENVNELKEKIFRTKARLLLLQETVLGGDITAGAKAVLVHRNEMGSQFVLESVSYALDGAPIFTRVDNDGDLDKKQEIEIFNGRIVPGNHAISVKLQYRGHGYGVFSYLEGYKFRVQSNYTFDAQGGKVTQIKIVGYERGNITTDLKDRPAVKYDVDVMRDTVKRASADAQAPAAGTGQGAEAAPAEARPQ